MPEQHISEIMQTVHSVDLSASVEETVNKMSSEGTDAILIEQGEEYLGIFTKADLIKLLEKNIDPAEVSVSSVMSKPIFTLDSTTTFEEARKKMEENNIRHYSVTQNGKIVGIISIRDLDT